MASRIISPDLLDGYDQCHSAAGCVSLAVCAGERLTQLQQTTLDLVRVNMQGNARLAGSSSNWLLFQHIHPLPEHEF